MPVLKNPRHEKFAQEVAKGLSASAAYQKVFSGCTVQSAETAGPKLLRSVQVNFRVDELKTKTAEKLQITREELVKMCIDIVKSKPSDAGMENPLCELKMSKQGPFATFPDKKGIMERLCKMLGFDAPEKHEIEAGDTLTAFMAQLATGHARKD